MSEIVEKREFRFEIAAYNIRPYTELRYIANL